MGTGHFVCRGQRADHFEQLIQVNTAQLHRNGEHGSNYAFQTVSTVSPSLAPTMPQVFARKGSTWVSEAGQLHLAVCLENAPGPGVGR